MSERSHIPSVNTDQMREVDRLMVEEYGITLLQMMENAGRSLARLAIRQTGTAAGRRFAVLAGKGGNGGGGLVAARHLHNSGGDVRVILAVRTDELSQAAAQQALILSRMGLDVVESETLEQERIEGLIADADAVIDALIGYSLAGDPRGEAARLIAAANVCDRPVLSLDTPSGVDAGSGAVFGPAVRAAATMTLALPKTGFAADKARQLLGDLYLADISVPSALYGRLGIEGGAIFSEASVLRLEWAGSGWIATEAVSA